MRRMLVGMVLAMMVLGGASTATAAAPARSCYKSFEALKGRWKTRGVGFDVAIRRRHRYGCQLTTSIGGSGTPKPYSVEFTHVRGGSSAFVARFNFYTHPDRMTINDGSGPPYRVYRANT